MSYHLISGTQSCCNHRAMFSTEQNLVNRVHFGNRRASGKEARREFALKGRGIEREDRFPGEHHCRIRDYSVRSSVRPSASDALIYVLVSDVTRARVRLGIRPARYPLVCAQRIHRHIIPGVAYINDRNWDLLCLSSATGKSCALIYYLRLRPRPVFSPGGNRASL